MTQVLAKDVPSLLTLGEAAAVLENNDPDGSLAFTTDKNCPVQIDLAHGWNADVHDKDGTDTLSGVTFHYGTQDWKITKEALLDLTSTMSIQREYMMRTPGQMMEPHVAYWLKTTERAYRFLHKDGVIVAMARKPSVVPFSNLDILERVVERAVDVGVVDNLDDVRVDFKMHHDLKYTAFRVILPEVVKKIDSKRAKASGEDDNWSVGIQIHNSLTGTFPLQMSGYLFSWFCANGATATHLDVAKYNRRIHGQDVETALEWVNETVDTLLHELPDEVESVAQLTTIDLASELSDTLRDVFERLKVPMAARSKIIDNVVDSSDTTAYGLMQAITSAANDPELPDEARTKVMEVGGNLPALLGDRCEKCHRLPA